MTTEEVERKRQFWTGVMWGSVLVFVVLKLILYAPYAELFLGPALVAFERLSWYNGWEAGKNE